MRKMLFGKLAEVFEKLESTTKRLEMTDILVALFKETPSKDIDKVVFLTLGEIYPPFVGLELGLAEKLAVKALSLATGVKEEVIIEDLKNLLQLIRFTPP
jgi:DNA ligase-1